jgi:hypothetical protein
MISKRISFRSIPLLTAALVCMAALPSAGYAQADTTRAESVQHRNDCRLARQILLQGQPENKRGWAVTVAPGCGAEGGQALASALNRHRRDAADSQELSALSWAASEMWDLTVFTTALAIAQDPSASVVGRVHAISVLHGQFDPASVLSYEEYLSAPKHFASFMTHREPLYGAPRPSDATEQIRDRLRQVSADPSAPDGVRRAADRVSRAAEGFIRFQQRCPGGIRAPRC